MTRQGCCFIACPQKLSAPLHAHVPVHSLSHAAAENPDTILFCHSVHVLETEL